MINTSATASKRMLSANEGQDRHNARAIASILSPKFTVVDLLAASDDAVVCLAEDKRGESAGADRLVMLKVLSELASRDPRRLDLFYLEARAAAKLLHKNIIKTDEAEQLEGVHFYAMAYRPACESLRNLLNLRAWLDVKLAASISIQVAEALAYAHEQGVLHLMLQPENVLIDSLGAVILTGFGVEASEEMSWARQARSNLIAAQYSSPEQAGGQATDHLSDLYSLGVLLFEMLTDRVPFDSSDPQVIRHKHTAQTPEPPHMYRAELPESISELVMGLLEKDPCKRPRAAELNSALDRAVRDKAIIKIGDPREIDTRSGLSPNSVKLYEELPQRVIVPEGPLSEIEIDRGSFYQDVDSLQDVKSVDRRSTEGPARNTGRENISRPPGFDSLPGASEDGLDIGTSINGRRKREPFEAPTIRLMDPPASEPSEGDPRTEPLTEALPGKEVAPPALMQVKPTSVIGRLFILLFIILMIAAGLLMLQARNKSSLKNFLNRASPAPPTDNQSSSLIIVNEEASQAGDPAAKYYDGNKNVSKDEQSFPGQARASGQAQSAREAAHIQRWRATPVARAIRRKPAANSARRKKNKPYARRPAKQSKRNSPYSLSQDRPVEKPRPEDWISSRPIK